MKLLAGTSEWSEILERMERNPRISDAVIEGRRRAEAERAERERLRGEVVERWSNDTVTQEGLQMCRDVIAAHRRRDMLRRPAAEVWMEEHPEEFTLETAPTVGAAAHLVRMERLRFKASRERLTQLGVR
ncbi:MAG TPA: hypothetical protein VJU84_08730 [Pyrinomonadaceae bacterium]|nr:hypothetical protein [Pyrinomonadaceae bacterium]